MPTEIRRLDATNYRLACQRLARQEPKFRALLNEAGMPPLRFTRPGFPTLTRIILGQQVSRAAARSVYLRLEEQASGRLTPEAVLSLSEAKLRAAGLSRQKVSYITGLAEAMASGAFSHQGLARKSDAEVMAEITALKGFGAWSAENYMIFALGRPDVMPAADLGILIGLQELDQARHRVDEKTLRRRAEAWRPLRSVAALMLWHLRDTRQRNSVAAKSTAPKAATKTTKKAPKKAPKKTATKSSKKAPKKSILRQSKKPRPVK